MTDRLHVATRKGLFEVARHDGAWEIADAHFLGDPLSAVLAEPDGSSTPRLISAISGPSCGAATAAESWRELPVPAFPPKPDDAGDDPHPWSLGKIWALEPGGVPGRLWAGTMPGGLFRSDDGGESWSLNEPLWHMPERRQWFGVAGGEQPGINSVLVDPRNPSDIRIGVSCAGLWASTDEGASWRIINGACTTNTCRRSGAATRSCRTSTCCALRRASRNRLVPAPQWCVPFGECRRQLARADGDPPVEIRLCRRRPPARSGHRLVRPGGQGRAAYPGRRQSRRCAHP